MVTGEVERKYADDGVKVQNSETEEKLEAKPAKSHEKK